MSKQNHHYVPKLHLRMFSCYPEKKRISLYNFSNSKLICGAAIRHQASKPDFYLNAIIEEAISRIESRYAECARFIDSSSTIPNSHTTQYFALLRYIMLQRLRTPVAAQEADEMFEDGLKRYLMSVNPSITQEMVDSVRLHQNDTPVANLRILEDSCKNIEGLSIVLLKNISGTQFITSDLPVIFYNQLFENKSIKTGNSGLGAVGLQIIFALSPEHAILLYDSDAYSLKASSNKQVIVNDTDVENINKLQIVNAEQQLFFHSNKCQYIKELVRKYSKRRIELTTEYTRINHPMYPNKQVKVLRRIEKLCRLKLSFMSIKTTYKYRIMLDGKVYLRVGFNSADYL